MKKLKKLENNVKILQRNLFLAINSPLAENIVTCRFLKKYSFKAYTSLIIELETELAASQKNFW